MNFLLDTDTCSAKTADYQHIPGLRLDDWLTP